MISTSNILNWSPAIVSPPIIPLFWPLISPPIIFWFLKVVPPPIIFLGFIYIWTPAIIIIVTSIITPTIIVSPSIISTIISTISTIISTIITPAIIVSPSIIPTIIPTIVSPAIIVSPTTISRIIGWVTHIIPGVWILFGRIPLHIWVSSKSCNFSFGSDLNVASKLCINCKIDIIFSFKLRIKINFYKGNILAWNQLMSFKKGSCLQRGEVE